MALFSASPDEATLWRLYQGGDITQIARLLPTVSDTLPAKAFFNSLFETDGLKAVNSYKMLAGNPPDSRSQPFALERIIAYECALGWTPDRIKSFEVLQRLFPDFEGLIDLEAIMPESRAAKLIEKEIAASKTHHERNIWSVQVGAFRNRKGAEAIGKKVSQFGKVIYEEKSGSKGTITIVKVGQFDSKDEAEKLAARIRKSTVLNPVVVLSRASE